MSHHNEQNILDSRSADHMRVLLSKLEKNGDDVIDIKCGILKIQANVAFRRDDSSQVKFRPSFKPAFRVDRSKVGDGETVKKQVASNQPPDMKSTLQSTDAASNSFVTGWSSTSTSPSVRQSTQRLAELSLTYDRQPATSFTTSREVLDRRSNWASRMSQSEDAEQTGQRCRIRSRCWWSARRQLLGSSWKTKKTQEELKSGCSLCNSCLDHYRTASVGSTQSSTELGTEE